MVPYIRKWFWLPADSVLLQVPRALAASCLAAGLDMAALIFMVEYAGWTPATAAIVGYLVGLSVQYLLCSLWVFSRSSETTSLSLAKFTLLSLVGLGLTYIVLHTCHTMGGIPYPLAKCFSLVLTFVWNFTTRRYLLFTPSPPEVDFEGYDAAAPSVELS